MGLLLCYFVLFYAILICLFVFLFDLMVCGFVLRCFCFGVIVLRCAIVGGGLIAVCWVYVGRRVCDWLVWLVDLCLVCCVF